MKIVFFGTPEYVVPILDKLHKTFRGKIGESPIAAVFTQPPKPVGRKQQLEYSPVDKWAYKKKVKIVTEVTELLKEENRADLGIVAAFGKIIPKEVINLFPKGILNIHPSLLPKWRGASPIQATILSGDRETGVTIIKVDELMDHGPILSQFKEEVLDQDTSETLRSRLFKTASRVLITLLPAYLSGKITARRQDHSKATYTKLLKKDHGFIPPEYLEAVLNGKELNKKWPISFIKNYSLLPSAYSLERFIRAMQPWPGAWTLLHPAKRDYGGQAKRLKILKVHLEKQLPSALCLVPELVQLEGKNPVSWNQFRLAYPQARFAN